MHFTCCSGLFPVVAGLVMFCADAGEAQRQDKPSLLTVSADHTNGVYQVGETIRWRVRVVGDNFRPALRYTLKRGEMVETARGDLILTNGAASLDSPADVPGHLLLEVAPADGWSAPALGGALIAPELIGLSAPRPADFDSFWDGKLKELAQVAPNAKLESVEVGIAQIEYWKLTMDNVGGSHIHGQLARPAQGGKLPALLILQWAGVYPLQREWVTDRAAQGWLALNIEPHDMPIDAGPSGAPGNYASLGNDDREKSYFLRMYLSACQAVQYLAGRPDWDGRTLVVTGVSMGGQQTLVAAGLCPQVTAALALVPAGADMLGPEAGRRGGYPQWYDDVGGKDPAKVHEASRYFDTANFAARIRCPVLVSFGLLDETSPPSGVVAAFNQIQSPKQMLILTHSPHQDVGGSQTPFWRLRDDVWLPALKAGRLPPMELTVISGY